ncbi:MAG: peptidoglycan-binding protein [Burkholderiales bacterium]|nr:peptidoglycan-binding protein [Burkholderiales bacterium]
MRFPIPVAILGALVSSLLCVHGAWSQGPFGYKAGGADAPVSGSAGPDGASSNAAPSLEKCGKPFGTIAVVEPQAQIAAALARYNLPAPTALLRLMIQQSNCFQVVERGMAMQNIMQERALAQAGQLQSDSNIGKGQLATADFLLTPQVAFSENNAGGAGLAAVGSLFGALGRTVGAVAGGMKFRQAQTTLLMSDARSGIQVAAAEGNVEKADWAVGGFLGGVGAGAYTNTAEGKVVAAALLDNYNNIVRAIRNQPSLIQARPSTASQQNAAASVQAGDGLNAGDVIMPKIAGIRLLAGANASANVLSTLRRDDELVYLGAKEGAFIKVQGSGGEGWVDSRMVSKVR